MESELWHLPAGSVALWAWVQKRDNGLFLLSVWEKAVPQISPWYQTLQFLPVCHWCLLSCFPHAGAQREWVWVSLLATLLRWTAWDSRSFFHQLNPCWFLQPEVMGTYLPGTGTLDWGPGLGLGLLTPKIPPEFLSTTCGFETSCFHISTSPTVLDGCGFFNPVVVGRPFISISDSSEWRMFYSLVVILMWLFKEVSHVYLHLCLDQKSDGRFFKMLFFLVSFLTKVMFTLFSNNIWNTIICWWIRSII